MTAGVGRGPVAAMTGPRARWTAATLLLLGIAAGCGGDDGGGAAATDKGPGVGSEGPCALLEVSDIEAVFGEQGAVADGEALGFSCAWEIGDTGIVVVTRARGAGSPGQSLDEIRDLDSDPVEVDGVGDEACLCSGGLWFRAGEVTFSVTPSFSSDVPDVEEKLQTLAGLMLERA